MENSDHFLSIAEIAGVFIGFSSLISLSPGRSRGIHYELRAIVTIGLLVLVAALLPVWLSSYALSERAIWSLSSGGFLTLNWIAILMPLLDHEYRAWQIAGAKANLALTIIFWTFLQIPIQIPLFLALLHITPSLAPAHYMTALVVSLFEAAFIFARIVYIRDAEPGS
jgi:hypothetical protein